MAMLPVLRPASQWARVTVLKPLPGTSAALRICLLSLVFLTTQVPQQIILSFRYVPELTTALPGRTPGTVSLRSLGVR